MSTTKVAARGALGRAIIAGLVPNPTRPGLRKSDAGFDMVTPLGKRLGDCTSADLTALARFEKTLAKLALSKAKALEKLLRVAKSRVKRTAA
jgi:hypothetical protein